MQNIENDKVENGKKYSKIIVDILWISALLLQATRIIIKGSYSETSDILGWIILGLLSAALIVKITTRFFPRVYKERPGREELDNK